MRTTRLAAVFFALLLWTGSACPQSFGKNKVQYDHFDWSYLRADHFDVYFYAGAEPLARRAAYLAEQAYAQISRDLGYQLNARVPVIVYVSHNHFEQTNVILELVEEEVGGFTELFKNRVVVPFEGSWESFRHVLHHELTHAVTFDMLYGNVLESLMSRQYLFQLPLWFAEGLAQYESLPWNAESDMFIRDAVISDYLPPVDQIQSGYIVYTGGHSIFRFLADTYGADKIGELLRKTAASRSVEQSLRLVTGLDMDEFSKKWQKALRRTHWPEVGRRLEAEDFAERLTDHKAQYSYLNYAPSFSPQGDKIAFLSDRDGFVSVYLMSAMDGRILRKLAQGETESKFEEMHWRRGAIGWSPDGKKIVFAAKAGARDALYIQRVEDGSIQRRLALDLDAVCSPDWSPDGSRIVFVGLKDAASDLYTVEIATGRLQRLTNDLFDETAPEWSPDGERIAFASDRAAGDQELDLDSLGTAYNIWTVRPDGTGLTRVAPSSADQRAPTWSPDAQQIAFISDQNGIYNLFVAHPDSLRAYPITDALTGCFSPDWSPDGARIAFVSFEDGGWDVYLLRDPLAGKRARALQPVVRLVSAPPDTSRASAGALVPADSFPMWPAGAALDSVALVPLEAAAPAPSPGAPSEETVVDTAAAVSAHVADAVTQADADSFPARPYRLKFSPDVIYASAGYSSYSGFGGQVLLSFSDVMGNHRCLLYTNLFYSLQDSDFQFAYYYLRRRTNYGLGVFQTKDYYVARDYVTDDYQWFSDRIYGGALLFSRPFSKFTRLDLDLLVIAIDRDYYYSTVPRQRRRVIFPTLSLINDTVLWGATGPTNGARSMATLEYCPDVAANSFSFGTASVDLRRYARFLKRYSFVFRVSSGVSFGEDPPRFFLGGTENWLSPKYARTGEWEDQDVYFAKFPGPLRGTRYYELSGTRFALLNTEFRYPFIERLVTGWPVSVLLGDVAGALFLDVGSAWTRDKDFQGIRVGPDGIPRLNSIKAGFGVGARANLGIAILRFDAAWRTDLAGTSAKPRYYLSLGSEF